MADLITTDTYKQAKGLTSSKEDERLELIVSSVNQLVKTYCGNSFVDYTTDLYTQYASPEWAIDTILLSEYPIIGIDGVYERSSAIEAYTELTDLTDYVINRQADTVVRVGANWPTGTEAVKVVYTAGYASLPLDLRLATVDLISYYMNSEHKIQRQLSGASMQNPGTSTLYGNTGFPDHIKRVLDLYRQHL